MKSAAGDTTIAGKAFDWPGYAPLVVAAKGDATVLFQLVTESPGTAGAYLSLAKLGTATGFTEVDGTPATMTVMVERAGGRL